jgi:hypothetical protein
MNSVKFSNNDLIEMQTFCKQKINRLCVLNDQDYSEWFAWSDNSKINIYYDDIKHSFGAQYYQYNEDKTAAESYEINI